MRTFSTFRILTAFLLILALGAGGCLFNPPEKPGGGGSSVTFHAYTHPDSLYLNFVKCWGNRKYQEYRDRVLYDGEELAPDGQAYEQFTFYFLDGTIDPEGNEIPYWGYETEADNAERIFKGQAGVDDVPPVKSIDLVLTKQQNWDNPDTYTVEGDYYPEGTLCCTYSTDMTIELNGSYGDNITAFLIQDALTFYAIPVDNGDGEVLYRLWKWMDLDP